MSKILYDQRYSSITYYNKISLRQFDGIVDFHNKNKKIKNKTIKGSCSRVSFLYVQNQVNNFMRNIT